MAPFAIGLVAGLCVSLARLHPNAAERANADPAPRPAANSPVQTRPAPWREILVGSVRAFNDDHISAAAAGVTFFGLLALFPALSAFVSLYGLFANVEDARRLVAASEGLLPGGAISVLSEQLTRLAKADHGSLGRAFAVSLAVSIWSANAGIKAMIEALNLAYEARERRGLLHLNLVTLGFTAGAILFSVLAAAFVIAAPEVFSGLGLPQFGALGWLRWPVFLVLMTGLFALLYRYGPCRPRARWRWVTPGGAAAALGWLSMSGLFSWYVANFGHYDKTYGSLGAIVGFLTWIWLSLMTVLFGAELNSELEKHDALTGRKRRAKTANPKGRSDPSDIG